MPTFNDARVRQANSKKPNPHGDYVLYWAQTSRRLNYNHALEYALHYANLYQKPLVVYEGLRLDYPWANTRHHQFFLQGMIDNAAQAKKLGVNYWPYVETPGQPAKGLLRQLSTKACLVVTDDYPVFVVPGQIAALAQQIDVPLAAIDGNGLIPLSHLGDAVSACAHLRPRVHRLFTEAWANRAQGEAEFNKIARTQVDAPIPLFDTSVVLDEFLKQLPIDQSVQPVAVQGGPKTGKKLLNRFIEHKLPNYAEHRNDPDDPKRNAASGLSPYLRHGHLSIQEIVEKALDSSGTWAPRMINPKNKNKRDGYYCDNPNINGFLDEAITWRDVGYHWHYCRNRVHGAPRVTVKTIDGQSIPTYYDLDSTLPEWAKKSLNAHLKDKRAYTYTLDEWENASTHDPLWNAAQKELVCTGKIHNYLRMLWGKKVLEWSKSPEEAYMVLEHLNNKYAIDGRDPNSYTGILWCFGLFDRPWPPERQVYGSIRYMSSDNTGRKYDLEPYYAYVKRLSWDRNSAPPALAPVQPQLFG